MKFECFKCGVICKDETDLNSHYLFQHGTLMPICTTKNYYDDITEIDEIRRSYRTLFHKWNSACVYFSKLKKKNFLHYSISPNVTLRYFLQVRYDKNSVSCKTKLHRKFFDNAYDTFLKLQKIKGIAEEKGILLE